KNAALPQHGIHQRGLAMVYVGDDGDVAYGVYGLHSLYISLLGKPLTPAKTLTLRARGKRRQAQRTSDEGRDTAIAGRQWCAAPTRTASGQDGLEIRGRVQGRLMMTADFRGRID